MSIRTASPCITVCETFRLINDLCQSDSDKDNKIRELCVLGIVIGKLISETKDKKELIALVQKYGINKNYNEIIIKRLYPEYRHNWRYRKEICGKWGMENDISI